VAQRARSSATASEADERAKKEGAKNGVELLDPRVAAAAVQVGGVRFAPGGEKVRPRQG
jgi:hypothetical protein